MPLDQWLEPHKELKEIYQWKERLHGFYRIKGARRAKIALQFMLSEMKQSQLPEIKKLHKTLSRWDDEILNYFKTGLTNAMTEGFNNIASLVKKRGFGYKNANNYRLRFLNACAH